VSVVDTYGLMHSKELLNYFDIFNNELDKEVILGYHAHNNFQMAYANSITLMNKGFDRTLVFDGSLYGMGKSAGNACTELLAMYMNEFCGRNFNINQLQEVIDVDILKEFENKSWGYNFEYYIAALNDCHPSYVQYLLDKKALSVKSINEILVGISIDKKLSYDKQLIEGLYREYQERFCDDALVIDSLKNEFLNRKVLLAGPGKTLQDDIGVINNFVHENNPLIISINFLNESLPIDYVFMGNAKRYSQFFHKIYGENSKAKIICTSNISEAGKKIDFTVSYSALLADEEVIRDNPLVMFLHLLKNIGITEVWLAGFDGYVEDNSANYYGEYVRFLYCQDNVILRNDAIKRELSRISEYMRITSLTKTMYL
jgi:4-hydroxy 2-oxovalerate aldolase